MDAKLTSTLLELIRRTSAFLPPDVEGVLAARGAQEARGSKAGFAMDMVMENIGLAKKQSRPICQDTGTITFYVDTPAGFDQVAFVGAAEAAVVQATDKGYLRQNSVDSITGKNPGNNLGPGSPVFYFSQSARDDVEIKLVLKGGGCENVGAQYKLPATFRGTLYGRDLAGVKACIMDAVYNAQGKGCGPGFLGVCIGGDRASSLSHAKKQLLRPLDDVNPLEPLALLEDEVMRDANELGIGPMGFGGGLTLGGCKIGTLYRLPASFFVSVSYMCWAYRRRGVRLTPEGEILDWLYTGEHEFDDVTVEEATFTPPTEGVKVLTTPCTDEMIRDLRVGDTVLIDGTVFTGRDAVHKYLHDGNDLELIEGGIIYHCGPVVLETDQGYKVMAAGPTTSIREEPYQADIIERFGIKAVIGKGGMGKKTLQACKEHGCVYLHAIGGAAQVYALAIKDVPSVHLQEFGSPEAVWEFVVEGFPAVVTMDAHGGSLHEEVEASSGEALARLEGEGE